jgi:hypothetical protein
LKNADIFKYIICEWKKYSQEFVRRAERVIINKTFGILLRIRERRGT